MNIQIGQVAPDFEADTTQCRIRFHEWLGDGWGVLFSHPKDFTPVCTTEFGAVAQLAPEWEKRGVKVLGVSVDSADEHRKWKRDIEAVARAPLWQAGMDFDHGTGHGVGAALCVHEGPLRISRRSELPLEPGMIYNANRVQLMALLREAGRGGAPDPPRRRRARRAGGQDPAGRSGRDRAGTVRRAARAARRAR